MAQSAATARALRERTAILTNTSQSWLLNRITSIDRVKGWDPCPTLGSMRTHKPAELARELGYISEARPGKVVRDYLRSKYPGHPKYQRWVLDEDQAVDVRANVPLNAERQP